MAPSLQYLISTYFNFVVDVDEMKCGGCGWNEMEEWKNGEM